MLKIFRHTSSFVFLSCFFLVWNFGLTAWGQTIHVILATDRADTNLGKHIEIDLDNVTHLFRSNVPAENLNLVVLENESMTPDLILQSIDKLNVEANDAIVFYYSGHGAYDVKTQKQFLQLEGRGLLYRETLLAAITKKSPRLTVVLTDCCNNKVIATSSTRSVRPVYRHTKSPNSFSPLFENLFVFCKGTADITSSKIGEYSFIDTKSRGSCFTWPLVELLDNNKTNEDLFWKDVAEKLGPRVQEAFRDAYPRGYEGQTKQSVYVYSLPGMTGVELDMLAADTTTQAAPSSDATPPSRSPRLGLRAISHEGGGVRITELAANSPAAKADFTIGEIIIEINGQEIKDETDYSKAVDDSPKRMEMKLKKANQSTRTVVVELGW